MQDLKDVQDCTDGRLEKFLYPLTLDQQSPFSMFAYWQLTVWPDKNAWMPYEWKTQSQGTQEDVDSST